MKYIKTEDRIYKTDDLTKCEDPRFPNGWFNKNGAPLVAKKQSDNIVELADYLLFKFKVEKKMVGAEIKEAAILEGLKSFMKDGSLDFARLFIFKGKDLKCVAEMNEKGEFELL